MPESSYSSIVRAAPLAFVFLWSTGFIVARFAAPDADPFTFLTVRCLLAILLLLVMALASRAPWPCGINALHAVVSGLLLHGGYLAGVWWAIANGLPAGLSALITAAQPLITVCLAWPLLGERVSPLQWVGAITGFVGILLVLAPRLSGLDRALLAGVLIPMLANFGATLSVTLGTFYQKRFAASSDLRSGTCLQFVGALVLVVPLMLLLEERHFALTVTSVAALAWSVIGLSIGAIGFLLLLIRHGAVSRVAALMYLAPPLTAIEAFLLFDEQLVTVQIVGMAVTAIGVWLATRR